MSIRLTLRTLLSYLDDTLEPAQAKVIGAKVAESEQARDLIERIKQVTRRRRLMTPATSGPGGIDPNTIAEYLDNEVSSDQANEVESICLTSEVHLAEVAACHQILTLVLGEPALVPPSAKQRMYALVKGPEAIPFRKPAQGTGRPENDLSSEIEPDHDETLRMGVPAVGGSRNTWLLVGGGVAIVCLLAFAVWQLVHTGPGPVANKGEQVANADGNKDKGEQPKENVGPKTMDKKEKETPEKKTPPTPVQPTPENKGTEFVAPKVESVEIKPPVAIKYTKASDKQEVVGKHLQLKPKELGVLLQRADKAAWTRVVNNADVSSARPLLALPGNKSVIILASGVELTLWGNLPEVSLDPFGLLESRIVIHSNALLDADLTLQRGRLIVRNKAAKDAQVRVRFENSTLNQEEHLEIALHGEDAAVVLERFGQLDREEPFFEKKDDPLRKGPTTLVQIYAYGRSAKVSAADASFLMDDDQRPVLQWQSRQGVLEPPQGQAAKTPYWLKGPPTLKDPDAKLLRDKSVQTATEFADALKKREFKTVVAETLDDVQKTYQTEAVTKKKMSLETLLRWRYAVRCLRAVDDIAVLFDDVFAQPNTPMPVRLESLADLQQWTALSRDNEYQLLDVIRKNYPKTPSTKIMELFHLVSEEDARKPATYETLIEGLNNDLLPIRFLCSYHLYALAPAGGSIPYDPAMTATERRMAVEAWLRVVPRGELPKAPQQKKK